MVISSPIMDFLCGIHPLTARLRSRTKLMSAYVFLRLQDVAVCVCNVYRPTVVLQVKILITYYHGSQASEAPASSPLDVFRHLKAKCLAAVLCCIVSCGQAIVTVRRLSLRLCIVSFLVAMVVSFL